MAISLYEASVGTYLQMLDGIRGCLDIGLAHCRDHALDPEEIVGTRLFPDMKPFRFQVTSTVHHSLGAVEGLKSGVFRPPSDTSPYDYTGLQALVAKAHAILETIEPAEIDAREDADVVFETSETSRRFTAEGFVMSFSLPHFYFHATTTYDILRIKGVPVGKRDYRGTLRLKG